MLTDVSLQNIEKAFKEMGYKTDVQPLAHFHDDYGLKGDDDEEELDDEDDEEDDDDEDDSEDDDDSDEDSD